MSWKFWKKGDDKKVDQPVSPNQQNLTDKSWEQLELERAQWQEMKVDPDEVDAFNSARKSRNKSSIDLGPNDLASIARNLNQLLRDNGYPIQFTYKKTLGLLTDQLVILARTGQDIPLPRLAIREYAEYKVRQKFKLSPRVDLNRDQLEEVNRFLKAMEAEAKANLANARVVLISQNPSIGAVADRQDLKKLIQYQAEVMARRKHPELQKGSPIPSDILAEEIAQAKADYRQMHKLPEDWESAYW